MGLKWGSNGVEMDTACRAVGVNSAITVRLQYTYSAVTCMSQEYKRGGLFPGMCLARRERISESFPAS